MVRWSRKAEREQDRRARRMAARDEPPPQPPLDPRAIALSELLAQLAAESGVRDLRPGARVVPAGDRSGLEVFATSQSRGSVRLGFIPHDELELLAERIRLSRDRAVG